MKKETNEEKIAALKHALLKRKYISIFLALFTLGVNIFAWFVFTTSASVGLDATVASWDVEFRDNQDQAMQNFTISVTKMKPGMPDFTKSIYIYNRSDVEADFIYEVTSFTLLGHTIQLADNATMINYLRTNYPFSINLNPSKVILSANDNLQFDVVISWPYDSQTELYYKQDDVYSYDPSLPYYRLSGGEYSLYEVANASVYSSMKSRLYFAKDEADTYFGMNCYNYEQNTGNACLTLNLRLLVQQRNASPTPGP